MVASMARIQIGATTWGWAAEPAISVIERRLRRHRVVGIVSSASCRRYRVDPATAASDWVGRL
jgi:hypothetical protein